MYFIKQIQSIFFNSIYLNFESLTGNSTESPVEQIENSTESPVEQIEKLSQEKLQTIKYSEFLNINKDNRLQHITFDNNKSSELREWDSIKFNFTFDWVYNKELWSKTTAWQVLPQTVRNVVSWGSEYNRSWLKWEFFNEHGSRLIINQDTELEIWKILTQEQLSDLQEENKKTIDLLLENNKYKWNEDIVKEAVYRDIDVDFAVSIFWEKVLWLSQESSHRKIILEDIFTDFDRLKGGINLTKDEFYSEWKYHDWFVLRLLRKVYKDWYENKAIEYWISEEKIEEFKSRKNTPDYLSDFQIQEIVNFAPQYIVNLVKNYFPEDETENALIICFWESSFKSNRDEATNINLNYYDWRYIETTDQWLFQINDYWHHEKYEWEDIYDPEVNVRVASEIFKDAWNSWKDWMVARKYWLTK